MQPVSSTTESSLWVVLGDVYWNDLLRHGSPHWSTAGLARGTHQHCCTQRLGFIQPIAEFHPWQLWLGSASWCLLCGRAVPRQVQKVLAQGRAEVYKCKAIICLRKQATTAGIPIISSEKASRDNSNSPPVVAMKGDHRKSLRQTTASRFLYTFFVNFHAKWDLT